MNNAREEEIALEIESRFANGFVTSKQARAEIVEIIRKDLSEHDAEIKLLKDSRDNALIAAQLKDDEIERLKAVIEVFLIKSVTRRERELNTRRKGYFTHEWQKHSGEVTDFIYSEIVCSTLLLVEGYLRDTLKLDKVKQMTMEYKISTLQSKLDKALAEIKELKGETA